MEKSVKTDKKEMTKGLKAHDGNLESEYDVDESKIDVEDINLHSVESSRISIAKIKESFLNSDIDIYLLANPFSGSREAKAYTSLPSDNYRFTLEGDNEVFLRVWNITDRDKLDLCKEYIKSSIDTKINRDAVLDDKPIKLSKYGKRVMVKLIFLIEFIKQLIILVYNA